MKCDNQISRCFFSFLGQIINLNQIKYFTGINKIFTANAAHSSTAKKCYLERNIFSNLSSAFKRQKISCDTAPRVFIIESTYLHNVGISKESMQ